MSQKTAIHHYHRIVEYGTNPFGAYLRALWKRHEETYGVQLSRKQFADAIGVFYATAGSWYNGQKAPDEANCFSIARFFRERFQTVLEMAQFSFLSFQQFYAEVYREAQLKKWSDPQKLINLLFVLTKDEWLDSHASSVFTSYLIIHSAHRLPLRADLVAHEVYYWLTDASARELAIKDLDNPTMELLQPANEYHE